MSKCNMCIKVTLTETEELHSNQEEEFVRGLFFLSLIFLSCNPFKKPY